MAANSKHIGDVRIWIEKVIDSCTTPIHEIGARHLIQNFEHLLLRKGLDDEYIIYTRLLRNKLDNTFYRLIEEKFKQEKTNK